MPTVGKMKFPYTPKGIKEASNYSSQSGKPMQVEGNYRGGGKVIPRYQAGGPVIQQPPKITTPSNIGANIRGGVPRPSGVSPLKIELDVTQEENKEFKRRGVEGQSPNGLKNVSPLSRPASPFKRRVIAPPVKGILNDLLNRVKFKKEKYSK